MHYRLNTNNRQNTGKGAPACHRLQSNARSAAGGAGMQPASTRNCGGAVSPIIVFSLAIFIAFVALAVDVMRTIHAAQSLRFAAESAGVNAYRSVFTADGQRKSGPIEDLAFAGLQEAGGAGGTAWNRAPAGPQNGQAQSDVQFDQSDVVALANPNSDSNDFFLKVRARRDGTDALKMLFIPAIYAFNSWSGFGAPPNAGEAKPFRYAEITTQPATRIGAGANSGSAGAGYASFPIAISNKQFLSIAQTTAPGSAITIDIVNSTKSTANAVDHIKGSFVNIYNTGGLQYYGDALGSLSIAQLKGTLEYFSSAPAGAILNPTVVERGSLLAAFDAGDQTFKTESASIITTATRAISPARFHVIPVIAGDPRFNQRNQVIGFARLSLTKVTQAANTGDITINATIGESTPMFNATIGTGMASVPTVGTSSLPAAEVPFQGRSFNPANNSIGSRLTGIVMAPALSPRLVEGAQI